MKMLIRNENDGVLIPIPQYPLFDPMHNPTLRVLSCKISRVFTRCRYTATLSLCGGQAVG